MNFKTARIIQVNRGQYEVSTDGAKKTAILAGKLQYQEIYPVIGDYVGVVDISDTEVLIQEVKERKSYLGRPDGSGHADGFVKTYVEQAMVANLDYLFIVTSMNDDFSVNRIARFVATSIQGGCKPVAILTKADLCPDKEAFIGKVRELCGNLEVYCVSALTGEGMEDVRKFLQPGITIGLMGSSGVGKSTLINSLAGFEAMKVGEIRENDSKGRHTTTHRELLDINGTYFIDTPGMREFGISDAEEGVKEAFDDIQELTTRCKFHDCHHGNEPGCAVQAALKNGTLSEERWELYRSLLAESNRGKNMALKKQIAVKKKQLNKEIW